MKSLTPRRQAYRMIALQMGLAILVAFAWLSDHWVASVSALLGGLTAVLPNLYFAHCFFAVTYSSQAKRIIKAFYWGEVIKLLSSAFLLILFSKLWPKMAPLPFFCNFMVSYLGIWLAPLIMRK